MWILFHLYTLGNLWEQLHLVFFFNEFFDFRAMKSFYQFLSARGLLSLPLGTVTIVYVGESLDSIANASYQVKTWVFNA